MSKNRPLSETGPEGRKAVLCLYQTGFYRFMVTLALYDHHSSRQITCTVSHATSKVITGQKGGRKQRLLVRHSIITGTTDFLRIITHARRYKSALKEVGVEQLEEVKVKLLKIINDRIVEEEAAKIEHAERNEKIRQYRESLAADGIYPDELLDGTSKKQSKIIPRQPKSEIWSEKGEHTIWTGQGRMPNVFKVRIEAGETLYTFLVD